MFEGLEALHSQGHSFTAISEERGEVTFGDGTSDVRVVIDPIDGSLNAKRMIPTCALSLAVASGERMEDVQLGYVYDFGSEEEYVARFREGAEVNGVPLDPDELGRGLEVVGLEGSRPEWISPIAERLEGERSEDSHHRNRSLCLSATWPRAVSTAWRRRASAVQWTPPPRS